MCAKKRKTIETAIPVIHATCWLATLDYNRITSESPSHTFELLNLTFTKDTVNVCAIASLCYGSAWNSVSGSLPPRALRERRLRTHGMLKRSR